MSDEASSILLKRAKFVVAALVALLLLGAVLAFWMKPDDELEDLRDPAGHMPSPV